MNGDYDEDIHNICVECEGEGGYIASPTADDGPNDGKDVWEECQYCNGRGYNGKLKGKIVAIDFDGVIASYDGWKGIDEHGNDCLGADILIHELIDKEAMVWIFSTRLNPQVNKGYKVPELRGKLWSFFRRNKNYPKYDPDHFDIWDFRGKPIADLYIDDRAYHHQTNATWYPDEIEEVMKRLEG